MNILPLTKDHAADVALLERFQEQPWRRREWSQMARSSGMTLIGCSDLDTLVGAAAYHVSRNNVSVHRLIVHPEWTYETAGRAMLGYMRCHKKIIVLLVSVDNIQMNTWLAMEGFRPKLRGDDVMEYLS
jgi:hypothetical protein